MQPVPLYWIDYTVLIAYVVFVIGIGLALARYMKTSADFLTSAHSIPTWVTGLAFISANLGALELVGMASSGAKYGLMTAHFYWVGAIPAMIFLAVFMMPFYYGSKARSVPEYLKMRFDERVRALNSVAFAVMTIFASGISMNALANLLNQLLGWDYTFGLCMCSIVVLIYVLKGGLTSAIYTEVLQFFMIVLGFAPVVYLGLKDIGGWHGLTQSLRTVSQQAAAANGTQYSPDAWSSAWKPLLAGPSHNPMGVDLFAMVFGLGFVLSFGYWCTNFLVVQRAMAARNMTAARNTPLVAAVPKMLFPALVIVPGMIAIGLSVLPAKSYRFPPPVIQDAKYAKAIADLKAATPADAAAAVTTIHTALGAQIDTAKVTALIQQNAKTPLTDLQIKQGLYDSLTEKYYDGVILSLIRRYCPPGLLGLALTGLLASFMSGMAGNVTAFNTVWTYDLYQAYFVKGKSDQHYFWAGQATTVAGIALSAGAAFFARNYDNAMDVIQLVFSFVNAPLFATFLLGMFWKRTTGTGAFFGLAGGILGSAVFHALSLATGNAPGVKGGYIGVLVHFPSEMAQNFWLAAFAFTVCFVLTLAISLMTPSRKTDEELKGLVYSLTPKIKASDLPIYQRPGVIGVVLLICCVILNLIFW
jgi:SSS family solute:Na+ symporter